MSSIELIIHSDPGEAIQDTVSKAIEIRKHIHLYTGFTIHELWVDHNHLGVRVDSLDSIGAVVARHHAKEQAQRARQEAQQRETRLSKET